MFHPARRSINSGVQSTLDISYQRRAFTGLPDCGPVFAARAQPRKLDVIGSSRVYQPNEQMGALGVASRSYENLILRYLRNDPAKYGVIFHGMMGI